MFIPASVIVNGIWTKLVPPRTMCDRDFPVKVPVPPVP